MQVFDNAVSQLRHGTESDLVVMNASIDDGSQRTALFVRNKFSAAQEMQDYQVGENIRRANASVQRGVVWSDGKNV